MLDFGIHAFQLNWNSGIAIPNILGQSPIKQVRKVTWTNIGLDQGTIIATPAEIGWNIQYTPAGDYGMFTYFERMLLPDSLDFEDLVPTDMRMIRRLPTRSDNPWVIEKARRKLREVTQS